MYVPLYRKIKRIQKQFITYEFGKFTEFKIKLEK